MKKNEHYFPTVEFCKDAAGEWRKWSFGGEGGMGAEVMDEGDGGEG